VAGSAQVLSGHPVSAVMFKGFLWSSPAPVTTLAESLLAGTPTPTLPVGRLRGDTSPPRLWPPNHCPVPCDGALVSVSPSCAMLRLPVAGEADWCRSAPRRCAGGASRTSPLRRRVFLGACLIKGSRVGTVASSVVVLFDSLRAFLQSVRGRAGSPA
jgi:hypothetical protein